MATNSVRIARFRIPVLVLGVIMLAVAPAVNGCRQMVRTTDRDVAAAIERRQRAALGQAYPADLGEADAPLPKPDGSAYEYAPNAVSLDVPERFETPAPAAPELTESSAELPPTTTASQPTTTTTTSIGVRRATSQPLTPTSNPAGQPAPSEPRELFTLTDALAYAQQHKRDYQSAKEDLYLSALALTLERHLWTPQFAANLRTVYGNFGEITDFDQAMRFVADLSVTQRLPYGGEFTAAAISTLIRDVKRTGTAFEGSQIDLTLSVPFLRGAGHVARENLIQLERELTYAVRQFERFRRRQLVDVAEAYLNLLGAKQRVVVSEISLENRRSRLAQVQDFYDAGERSLLDVKRQEQSFLSAENSLAAQREAYRLQADRFKLLIGMPVDEPLEIDDLQSIEQIERLVEGGSFPLLRKPVAVNDVEYCVQAAIDRRLDLLTRQDRIDDARRGMAVARNDLLPDLDWTSSLTFDTDPDHSKLGAFEVARATWRSEVLLALPLERTRERNAFRSALISVRQAQRSYQDALERIRVDVRAATNGISLQERFLEIQRRSLEVAELRLEYAALQYKDGEIDNRDLVEAEEELTNARNALNAAKTDRWNALLELRLATETLLIDEDGVQHEDPGID